MLQVFLDFDGTIVDSKSAHYQAYEKALSHYGYTMMDDTTNWFGQTTKSVIKQVVGDGLSSDFIDNICSMKSRLAREYILNIKPNDNILDLLSCQNNEISFTIFSNSSIKSITQYIEVYLTFVKFKGICSGQDLGLSKLVDDELILMVEKFKIYNKIIFIDDSLDFIKMCNRHELPSIYYNKMEDLRSELFSNNHSMCR
jgi:phosphoglycolate phosphatase-like HAD superfamily hydrolase